MHTATFRTRLPKNRSFLFFLSLYAQSANPVPVFVHISVKIRTETRQKLTISVSSFVVFVPAPVTVSLSLSSDTKRASRQCKNCSCLSLCHLLPCLFLPLLQRGRVRTFKPTQHRTTMTHRLHWFFDSCSFRMRIDWRCSGGSRAICWSVSCSTCMISAACKHNKGQLECLC